jgi:hypothetical protein
VTITLEMIDSSGAGPRPAHDQLAAAIDVLRDCEQVSNACAMAMIDLGEMVNEVRRALDCADICQVTERVLSRGPATDAKIDRALVEACILACQASAEACGRHADHHEHCRIHSECAARCANALDKLAASFTS